MRSTSYNQISAGGNKLEQPLLTRYYAKPQKRPECLCITKRNASLCKYAVPAKPQLKVIAAWDDFKYWVAYIFSSYRAEANLYFCYKRIYLHMWKKRSPICGVRRCSGNECTRRRILTPLLPAVTKTLCSPAPKCRWDTGCTPACARASPLPHQCVWEGLFYTHWSMDYFRLLPTSLSNP